MKTSLQVLGYRAAHLGIMEPKDHFYASLHRKGYLKQEPLDDVLTIQKPMKMKTLIDLVATKGIIDISETAGNEWKVEIPFFYQLTGIPTEFFNKYVTRTLDFGLQNVTDISKLVLERDTMI
ncbi:hypothetical protein D3C77_457380 [compost metagenome]